MFPMLWPFTLNVTAPRSANDTRPATLGRAFRPPSTCRSLQRGGIAAAGQRSPSLKGDCYWCCQSNANFSPFPMTRVGRLYLGQCFPLGEYFRSMGFILISIVNMMVLIEVIVNGGRS
ncbi:MAG: hypothetical protein JWM91_2605 [Rhodospirillales bacterium]|nr:hypothetical protein [Rhodospirillales bacterium]